MIYMPGYKMTFAKNEKKMYFQILDNQVVINTSMTDFRKSYYWFCKIKGLRKSVQALHGLSYIQHPVN